MKIKNYNEKKLNLIINICLPIISILVLYLIYYFTLPVINLRNAGFYFFLLVTVIILGGSISRFISPVLVNKNYDKLYKCHSFDNRTGKINTYTEYGNIHFSAKKIYVRCVVWSIVCFFAILIIGGITGAKLFNAKSYYKQLPIEQKSNDAIETDFSFDTSDVLLPQIDKDLAFRLAQSSLGNYGSQYSIDYDNFTIISVNDGTTSRLVRIAPLEYANFFVSLNRMNKGTVGYIEVDVVNKTSKLVTFEDGLKYMPSAILSKDLDRLIRFNYPTAMYEETNFEIDDEGNPYWVVPTYKPQIGLFDGAMPDGVIIVNPINGDINKYAIGEEPSWVDRCVSQQIVSNQSTNALRYKNGFFNVHFGAKKDVFQLSDGYNYFIKGGNTYFVSCITSPNDSDETSIGFVAINLKNKQAYRYSFTGITEFRAREIAQADSRVKAQALDSTWPILIDFQSVPTYFIVLKNDVQAQKVVFMNVKDGSLVAMGNSIDEAKAEYDRLLSEAGQTITTSKTITGVVSVVRDLTTTKEFMITTVSDKYFVVNVSLNLDSRFLKEGDEVEISYTENPTFYYVTDLKKTN